MKNNNWYYKAHRTIEDVNASEFAFSLVYDNIAPDKISMALESVQLRRMPNILMLVQVDDYVNESLKYKLTDEFKFKQLVIGILRSYMNTYSISSVIGNLIGTDLIAVLLCIDSQEAENEIKLLKMADEIRQQVKRLSNVSVSICISEQCKNPADFSREYLRSKEILNESFYLGRNVGLKVSGARRSGLDATSGVLLQGLLQDIYIAISSCSRNDYEDCVKRFMNRFRISGTDRSEVIMTSMLLLDKICSYVYSCTGVSLEETDRILADGRLTVMRCSYSSDVEDYLISLFGIVEKTLAKHSVRNSNTIFREPVNQFIENHYKEKISLEMISNSCHYSKFYFSRRFSEAFKVSFSDYLSRFRVEKAKNLLEETSLSIESISLETGFSGPGYFGTVFKSITGMTPGEYRESHVGK